MRSKRPDERKSKECIDVFDPDFTFLFYRHSIRLAKKCLKEVADVLDDLYRLTLKLLIFSIWLQFGERFLHVIFEELLQVVSGIFWYNVR